jgi:DNA-binding beta-propeller fold protein YncE
VARCARTDGAAGLYGGLPATCRYLLIRNQPSLPIGVSRRLRLATRAVNNVLAWKGLTMSRSAPHLLRPFLLTVVIFVTSANCASANATGLTTNQPVEIPRAVGFFDYMMVDNGRRRVIAAHTESSSVVFVNADTSRLEREVYLGAAPHGLSLDERDRVYLVGTSGAEHGVFLVDRDQLNVIDLIHTPGPVDALSFDSRRGTVYADEDDGDAIWVISVASRRIIDTIHTPRDSDKGAYDPFTDRVYQNFTSTNSTLIIDPVSHQGLSSISTLPATRPHGLALDHASNSLFVAGVNGKLVQIDLHSLMRVSSLDITAKVDQIAIDAARRRLYCASGTGHLSIVDIVNGHPTLVANVSVPRGAHTLAIDSATGSVWLSYGTQGSDYLIKLTPTEQKHTPHAAKSATSSPLP